MKKGGQMTILIPILTLGGLGLAFGIFLTYAARKFHVEVDPRVERIMDALPGANCGACGAPGCEGFAIGVVEGKYPVHGCIAGGEEVAQRIAEIMGVEAGEVERRIAVVKCRGDRENAPRLAEYQGIKTCKMLDLIGGDKGCVYGCLGLGDCVEACPFEAIYMGENGLPIVIEERCTGCGECVRACPRGIMEIIPYNKLVYVACVSPERGQDITKVCKTGCIGCSLCARLAPEEKITMDGFLPVVHHDRIENYDELNQAVEKCPTKVLIRRNV